MYWLAINREWTSIQTLASDIVPQVARASLLEALESLGWRSLIEQQSGRYTQQPVVMEYIIERLIEQIVTEIIDENPARIIQQALLKTTANDVVQQTQFNLILEPIANQLLIHLGSAQAIAMRLTQCLDSLRGRPPAQSGYAGGNVLNLMRQLQIDVTHYDFSNLTIWQAYLQGLNLHEANFSQATFSQTTFTTPSAEFMPLPSALLAVYLQQPVPAESSNFGSWPMAKSMVVVEGTMPGYGRLRLVQMGNG